jgi:DNA polymerase I-like protein with 3'-5' exonuclease and polymerase domains
MNFPNLKDAKRISLDLETYDPDLKELGPGCRGRGFIAGISVAVSKKDSWYFPMAHEQGKNLYPKKVLSWLQEQFKDGKKEIVGANLMYDLDFLQEAGVTLKGTFFDVLFAEPLIDENQYRYNLESVSQKYLGRGKKEDRLWEWAEKNIGGKITEKVVKSNIWRMPGSIVAPYAIEDAVIPLQVRRKQLKILEEDELEDLCRMENDLIPMLLAMRKRGVRVDTQKAKKASSSLARKVKTLQRELNNQGAGEINPKAPTDLVRLFNLLDIPFNLTKKGNPTFTAPWFESLDHPVGEIIRNLKKFDKAKKDFVDGAITRFQIENRIHCLFHPLKTGEEGTVSGRYSSTLPNLQQVPARDPFLGPLIRSIFVPEPGEDWYKADYSQIEPRILLHYAKGRIPDSIRAQYAADPSIDCYDSMLQMAPSLGRKKIKTIYLGACYGMGKPKMAAQLGMSMKEAEPFFDEFHKGAPYVKDLAYATSDRARSRGYIKTILGRRSRFNKWEPTKWDDRDIPLSKEEARERWGNRITRAGTHKALNRLIQGGAADVMKKSMVDVWKSGVCDVLGAPLLTVHDELDFSVPRNKAGREAIQEVKRLMEDTIKLKVPLLVDLEKGPSWGEVK